MWFKAKKFWGSLGFFLFSGLRLYSMKSHLYRAIFERKFRNVEISTYSTWEALVAFVDKLVWTADSWEEGFDAFSYPGKVEIVGNAPGVRRVGDCDEFAIYLAAAITKSITEGVLEPWRALKPHGAEILTVTWMDKNGKYGGHNACLIWWTDSRGNSKCSYMDYSEPSTAMGHPAQVKNQVMARYAPEGTCLGWSIMGHDLSVRETHWE